MARLEKCNSHLSKGWNNSQKQHLYLETWRQWTHQTTDVPQSELPNYTDFQLRPQQAWCVFIFQKEEQVSVITHRSSQEVSELSACMCSIKKTNVGIKQLITIFWDSPFQHEAVNTRIRCASPPAANCVRCSGSQHQSLQCGQQTHKHTILCRTSAWITECFLNNVLHSNPALQKCCDTKHLNETQRVGTLTATNRVSPHIQACIRKMPQLWGNGSIWPAGNENQLTRRFTV